MAVLAAYDALADSRLEITKKKIGIIASTAFGAHVTTFDFLNDILDYGDINVSPTTFSNSVHNAAASYISSSLGLQGPTLTVTQFFSSFYSALQLAGVWLSENRCNYILAGAFEQYGDVLGYVYDSKLTPASDGRIKPFNFKPVYHVPGEGAVFFLLGNEISDNAYCKVENISMSSAKADLTIINANGLLADESVYLSAIHADIPTAAYSPLFGSMMIGSAFNYAAGALMLKNQMSYAAPVKDNPHGLNIIDETKRSDIELIQYISYNCKNEKAAIFLSKK
ncbi:MAG: beta-ketoacyl synthase chain length factor [Nitrospirae bacterium]|nr:beta-ketoacyl synthase chain length factor [Nitrospirota bacterium]